MSEEDYRAYLKGYEQAERDNEAEREEKPAPVAVYMGVYGGKHIVGFTESKLYPVGTALYLNPPKTKATVYLTKDEIEKIWKDTAWSKTVEVDFARSIEQEVLRRNK